MKTVECKNLLLKGETGALVDNIINNWLIGLRQTNPAIIDIFRDRDVKPYRDLLPWSGEFAGKYITGAYYAYKLTGNKKLYNYIIDFIDELLLYQDNDGYLGCFSKECHLTGCFSQDPAATGHTWDSWNHYHIMYGLLLWYDLTENQKYFCAVEKTAQLFMNTFYDGKKTIVSIGFSEMNLAIYHIFGILYRKTKNPVYLDFALKIENDLSDEAAGDYINYSLKGYEFYQCAKPRWESLHIIMGLTEMYRNTGVKKYLDVASQIFFSILKTDVHNTGAFSTDEQAIGHPFKNSNIETCCVIAYNALAIELYAITGDLRIIDFLERSHYNAILGYNSPTGKWSTYNTPMEGTKCANYHSINFQCRPGSPDLNCCSVNAARGVANVSEWMITENNDTVMLNFFEDMSAETSDDITFKISGGYPASNTVHIAIDSKEKKKNIAFRIPSWSKNTVITVDGEIYKPTAGEYFPLDRVWNCELVINFDFTPHTQKGAEDYTGKSSIFIGPVLYGFDNGDNPSIDYDNIPAIKYDELIKITPSKESDGSIRLKFTNGMVLKDFYHLGLSGCFYKTWFTVE